MKRVLVYSVVLLLLAACGLKGPLYLPEQKPGAKPQAGPAQNATPDERKAPESK